MDAALVQLFKLATPSDALPKKVAVALALYNHLRTMETTHKKLQDELETREDSIMDRVFERYHIPKITQKQGKDVQYVRALVLFGEAGAKTSDGVKHKATYPWTNPSDRSSSHLRLFLVQEAYDGQLPTLPGGAWT